MARRIVYRDYREGRQGKFVSKETYNRSRGQGVTCHIHREFVQTNTITSLAELAQYEDEPDLVEEEYHGTGDT